MNNVCTAKMTTKLKVQYVGLIASGWTDIADQIQNPFPLGSSSDESTQMQVARLRIPKQASIKPTP